MYTNVNLAAPIGALALLGTGCLLFIAALVLLQSLVVRKRKRAGMACLAVLLIGGFYLITMLTFSLASHDKLLARGEEKHFCELDCHLAYSVVAAQPANSSGPETRQTIVTIKTRFDETTIAPWRGNGLLYPNRRALALVDDGGHMYGPVAQSGTPLTTPLRPGESYTTDVVFNLPANTRPLALLLNEDAWETRFVIGHENSLLHGKTKFQI
jgi:hypothetical protein